ncbi:transmembrane protein 164-like [Liolophura sinensis]|uniref:transmembrane protein 164-like n=1 Tax=Liolophura sinensis TaxID=3198878 RepID=UPI0031594CAF
MASSDVNKSAWHGLVNWAYDGVDYSLPGNGGEECVNFLDLRQRVWESAFASCFAFIVMIWGYTKVQLPQVKTENYVEPISKRILLVLMCLTFGTELGFKFATRQMIWILNPCHLVTMLQIFLLAAPPCRVTTVVFRLHMHMLAGASIALLFPVINTRLLPFETCVYYVQHVLIVTVPCYLMSLGGAYTPERLGDFSWSGVSLGILFLYHFLPLQWLAVVSHVNLNNMLCPAISDPFYGRFYRVCAMTHQSILIPTHGKLYTWVASLFLSKHSMEATEERSQKGSNSDTTSHTITKEISNGGDAKYTKDSKLCNGHTKLE